MRILIGFAKLTCLSFIVTASFGGINIEDFDKRERSLPYLTSDTADEFDTVGQLVSYVKSTLVKKTDADIYASMQKHYEKLRLFKEGVWVHPTLQSRADELLPPLNSVKNCSALVDEMGRVARGNPYLLSALNTMEETHLSALKEKAARDGAEILPDVVTYACSSCSGSIDGGGARVGRSTSVVRTPLCLSFPWKGTRVVLLKLACKLLFAY